MSEDGVYTCECTCAQALPSGGAEEREEEEIYSVRTDVAALVAEDMEKLTVLREAWGGRPAKVAAREAYFKFLLTWRWELDAVDRQYVAEWFDKDPNAMLVYVTMLTPHVYDSTCSLEECLPWTQEEISADFSASEGICAKNFLEHNDERRTLFACAACGIRDPTLEYTLLPIFSPKVARYMYTSAQLQQFEAASPNYRLLKSSYQCEGQGRYHLHQELVSAPAEAEGAQGSPTAQFCEVCLRGSKPSALSIAAGVDFGWAARLQLPVPSTVEKAILARYRVYATTLKLRTAEVWRAAHWALRVLPPRRAAGHSVLGAGDKEHPEGGDCSLAPITGQCLSGCYTECPAVAAVALRVAREETTRSNTKQLAPPQLRHFI
jgi:hypothetical protein